MLSERTICDCFFGPLLLSQQVQWPDDTEILLADMPPSTASEVFSFSEHLTHLLGVVIVSQPSEKSALGMRRTVDFLRLKEVPIIGLVSMMDGYLCPNCDKVSHQLLSPKLGLSSLPGAKPNNMDKCDPTIRHLCLVHDSAVSCVQTRCNHRLI